MPNAVRSDFDFCNSPAREDWEGHGIPDFVYGQKELTREGIQWPRTAPSLPDTLPLSRFDSELCSAWRQRMELGLFRYRLGELQTQTLPGPMGFVAQLNVERGVQRRRPQNIRSVRQAFDPEEFNFNKIRPGEVLFPLRAGLEAVLLSSHPGFRVGFNSLGGLASVNHLHLHGYYLPHRLPVEGAPSEPLDPGGRLHLLQAVPAPGFLFYTRGPGPDLEALISRVCRATDYLTAREIAHNLFVTRGAPPGKTSFSSTLTGVRVILWPRKSSFGVKEREAFNVALCELAGHLPVKTPQDFSSLNEAAALALIQDCLLPPAQAEEVRAALVALTAQEEQ
ncbi:GDP-D-glucose phosphorylase like protein [Myotis brandtii]|uniref:GDP-D-glucose phosphorylase 1 n=1 Tax=Myotis brandtii TaxID=109478 RepID=S7PWF3_MYOBR|nr:GDP-D-glucose phosphorylase like protein [Myotis brandtii]